MLKYLIVYGAVCLLFVSNLEAQTVYKLGPNTSDYPGIPKGQVTKYSFKSKVFEGTVRDYYVYVPAQYKGEDAALMVFQDGHAYVNKEGDFRVPTVFDNLIAQGKMPITIGLFVNPGHDIAKDSVSNPFRSSNRSIEYDEVSGRYGEMIINELIPELQKHYKISDQPNMHAIAGLSSGGICAFSAAWFHNDYFQKVISHYGSFTDIRGGHDFPPLIRKNDKKNIKVYLQDGSADLNNQFGNWWLANLQLESALEFKGYDFKFDKGDGGHNGKHAGSVLPQSLEWLWSDVVDKGIESKTYAFPRALKGKHIFYHGNSAHFQDLELAVHSLDASAKTWLSADHEQMFLFKEGKIRIKLIDTVAVLSPGSVVFLDRNDKLDLQCEGNDCVYYQMAYKTHGVDNQSDMKPRSASFYKDFDKLTYAPHDRGGLRNYFRTGTDMCPYYEMHMTNLNPGIKSHEPHTHKAAELILILEGETRMEIGNQIHVAKAGDLYFLESNVPHAIQNTGKQQSRYFAYQWD